MSDVMRSLGVLTAAFVGVAAVTLGVAGILASGEAALADPDADEPVGSQLAAADFPREDGIPGLGGELTVTGDRQGTFRLGGAFGEGFALAGSQGRIAFEGLPVRPTQISYEGLEFFPDDGACTLAPGNLDTATGIGVVELECTDLVDVRGNGTVSLAGTLGLPVDLLAERQLPPSGGSLAVGDETWTFAEAFLVTWQQPAIAGVSEWNLALVDESRGAVIGFDYDIETHRLTVANVTVGELSEDAPPDACILDRTELGKQDPRTTVIELIIDCPAVVVPGVGTVPISGTVVVDELAFPE